MKYLIPLILLTSCTTQQNLPRDVGKVEIIKIVKVTDKYTIYRIKESDGNKSNYLKTDKKYSVGDVVEAYPHKDYYHNQWY